MLYKVPILLSPRAEGGFRATSPLIPTLSVDAETPADCLTRARAALVAMVADCHHGGRSLPAGVDPIGTKAMLLDAVFDVPGRKGIPGAAQRPKTKVAYRQKTMFEVDVMRQHGFMRASELGTLFGVNQTTIYRWAAEHHIEEKRRRRYRYFAARQFIVIDASMAELIDRALVTPAGRWSANRLERVEIPEDD